MIDLLVVELPILAGQVLLFWFVVMWPLNREKALRKDPFTRDLVRAPGEGCLEKMTELNDRLDSHLLLAILGPAIFIGYAVGVHQSLQNSSHTLSIVLAILLVTALGTSVYGMFRVRTTIRERINYRLGFLGERHTAQALSSLAAEGYKIYHDLQCRKPGTSETFNIDHVLLGPAGIIAIETKTRSKPANLKGRAEVTFDGKALDFGTYRDAHGIQQALANASSLAGLVAKRSGTRIPVTAILCLPGWWVTAKTHQPLFVGNSEQVPSRVRALSLLSMDIKTRNQIAALFEELAAAKVE